MIGAASRSTLRAADAEMIFGRKAQAVEAPKGVVAPTAPAKAKGALVTTASLAEGLAPAADAVSDAFAPLMTLEDRCVQH